MRQGRKQEDETRGEKGGNRRRDKKTAEAVNAH